MARHIDVMGLAESCDLQERRVAAAAGNVRLLHVDGAGGQHPSEIVDVVSIFAGGDVHAGRGAPADECEAGQIIRRNGLLEPAYVPLRREAVRQGQGLPGAQSAVCVYEQSACTDCLPGLRDPVRVAFGIGPDLILTALQPSRSTHPDSCSRSSASL